MSHKLGPVTERSEDDD